MSDPLFNRRFLNRTEHLSAQEGRIGGAILSDTAFWGKIFQRGVPVFPGDQFSLHQSMESWSAGPPRVHLHLVSHRSDQGNMHGNRSTPLTSVSIAGNPIDSASTAAILKPS